MFNIKPLKSEQDYKDALGMIDTLWDAPQDSDDGDYLDILVTLVAKYEEIHFKIDEPDPIAAIKFIMEQQNLQSKDLISILGTRSRVSQVLNKKRKLNLSMIRKLHNKLRIPYDVLASDYSLN
ncbi:MAG: type II toxin-antitoxin system HigA family antitoxin [Alphaproteobacteria bacterium]|jgi:HTH-type transcriptional regulator/antitoxin HigA|nr:transcriptional regulator [Candidatus Jidaibacter sp.]